MKEYKLMNKTQWSFVLNKERNPNRMFSSCKSWKTIFSVDFVTEFLFIQVEFHPVLLPVRARH